MNPYTKDFYKSLQEGSRSSADEIVPLVLELIHPKSVIDVGCGTGEWLLTFQKHGVNNFLGIDGEWVDRALLQIPEERFLSVDLKKLIQIDRHFDLVVSLEVAEHLHAECAECFVDSLTRLGPVILFSAAIPFQGGTDHVNEQWPTYWAEHFKRKGYISIDCIRKRVWDSDNVDYWYAQNIVVYVERGQLQSYHLLEKEYQEGSKMPLVIVHPRTYLWKVEAAETHMRRAREAELALQKAELALQNTELALHNTELALQNTELALHNTELALQRAQPINLPLRKILSVLPAVMKRAFRQRVKAVLRKIVPER